MTFYTLITAEQLAQLQDPTLERGHLVVLDCQFNLADPAQGYRSFCDAHIANAQHADLDQHGASAAGAGGRHPLPTQASFLAQMQRWGIHNHSQVVVYDRSGGAFAARFWWCLRWLGHAKVALLDGGLDAYRQPLAKGPDAARNANTKPTGGCTQRPSLTRLVSAEELLVRITHTEPGAATYLVDARSKERFDGSEEPIDPIAGHIPGATCLPFQQNMDHSGYFLPTPQLAQRFDFITQQDQLEPVSYCGSGVTAAHNILAMVHAGCAEPLLYPGSWSEWIVDPTRPRLPAS